MKKIIGLFISFLMVILLSGCGTPASLADTKWTLTGWSISSLSPDIATITILFKGETTIGGTGGVNSYGANYRTNGTNEIMITDLNYTEMASSNPLLNQAESNYFTLLQKVKYYEVTNHQLILLDTNHNELLIFEKQ